MFVSIDTYIRSVLDLAETRTGGRDTSNRYAAVPPKHPESSSRASPPQGTPNMHLPRTPGRARTALDKAYPRVNGRAVSPLSPPELALQARLDDFQVQQP